jgi:hypothetical protein
MTSRSWRSKWRTCAPTSACTASESMALPRAVARAYGPGQLPLGERGRRFFACSRQSSVERPGISSACAPVCRCAIVAS